jgi:putative addiction module killer protein
VIEVRETADYARWFAGLVDERVRAKVLIRLRRLSLGNLGDVRPVGRGVSELRIDWGPGLRVYFVALGDSLVILLGGGDKSTQARDIERALDLAMRLKR